jgi:hypothetical protein
MAHCQPAVRCRLEKRKEGGARLVTSIRKKWPLLVLCAGFVAFLVLYFKSAYSSGIGSLNRPGEGLFPVISGAIAALGLVAAVFEWVRGRAVDTKDPPPDGEPLSYGQPLSSQPEQRGTLGVSNILRTAAVIAVICAFAIYGSTINFPYVGTFAGIGVVSFVVMLMMRQSLWSALIVAIALAVLGHLIFGTLLHVPLNSLEKLL